jgi:hypothetical protein
MQNNSGGTSSQLFQLDTINNGPNVKNNGGELQARDAADGADAPFSCSDATLSGVLKGTDDGTAVVVGHAPGAAPNTGSALQPVQMTTAQRNNLLPSNGMIIYNTTNAQLEQYNSGWGPIGSLAGAVLVASQLLALGELLALDSAGQAVKATAATVSGIYRIVAASPGVVAASATFISNSIAGTLAPVLFAAPPVAVQNGSSVYLSTVAGVATLADPSAPGVSLVEIGVLQGANGVTSTPNVMFFPIFRVNIP